MYIIFIKEIYLHFWRRAEKLAQSAVRNEILSPLNFLSVWLEIKLNPQRLMARKKEI